jgi:hypothetical protein
MSLSVVLSISALFLTLVSLVFTYFGWIVDIKEKLAGLISTMSNSDFKDIVKRLCNIEVAVARIETSIGGHSISDMAAKLDLFWTAMEPAVKTIIHDPTHYKKDDLIDRFPSLNDDELYELRNILTDEMVELKLNKSEKIFAYAFMVARVDSVLYDNHKKL